jgi:hypothetical protein
MKPVNIRAGAVPIAVIVSSIGNSAEIASTMLGDKATSMVRLGDTYAGLARYSAKLRPGIFVTTGRNADPQCTQCGKKMRLTYSLARTGLMPAMQAFRSDCCGETLIWKSK